jgi:signal transduction histidine kinase
MVVTSDGQMMDMPARLAFLTEASRLLGASLDYRVTLRKLARLVVPTLADACLIDIVEADGALRRGDAVHVSPLKESLLREIQRNSRDPVAPFGAAQVIETRKALVLPTVNDEQVRAMAQDREQLNLVRALELRAVVVVPLLAQQRVLGAMTLLVTEAERQCCTEMLALAQELGHQAAIAIENAQLHQKTQEALRNAQRHAEQLQGLMRAALAINSALSIDEVLLLISEQARAIVGAHQAIASFALGERWSRLIHARSLSEKYSAWQDAEARSDGVEIYALICPGNHPIRLTQAELLAHPAWQALGAQSVRYPPMRGWLAAPLTARNGQRIGLLQLSDKYEGEFSAHDEAIIVQLAQMASVAVENARLFREVQEGIQLRDAFLSIASHELKTPITGIKGYADLLLRRAARAQPPTARDQRALYTIQQEAARLTRLIELLLDFVRIQTGEMRFDGGLVNLGAVVRRVVGLVAPTLDQRHHLRVVGGDERLLVAGDEARLTQVIENLISNAIKYSPAGGEVTVQVERQERLARLSVSDHGMGISPEVLTHLFHCFYRADSSNEQGIDGIGLGLYVVRYVLEAHGGKISVNSQPGTGSIFQVDLPLFEVRVA